MEKKKKTLCVEVTDIFEPEQEDFVIEAVGDRVKQSREELKDYFETTDTIVIKRLARDEADAIVGKLEGKEVSVRIFDMDVERGQKETETVRCPKCGFQLEYPDWRCPECYYEFPDFELRDEES